MFKFLNIITLLSIPFLLNGQSFVAEVSNDSILIGNYIEVSFKAENVDGKFEEPSFENAEIISGPNMSSSIEIVNGDRSSSLTWSYYIKPIQLGEATISPSFFVADSKTFETEPIVINVYPNPEGIIENPKQKNDFSLFGDFGSQIFESPFRTAPKTEKKDTTKKSKRKLKRI